MGEMGKRCNLGGLKKGGNGPGRGIAVVSVEGKGPGPGYHQTAVTRDLCILG